MNDKNKITSELNSKFEKLMIRTDTDAVLKQEVMSTITKIEHVVTFIDLFTIKLIKTKTTLLQEISSTPKGMSQSDNTND